MAHPNQPHYNQGYNQGYNQPVSQQPASTIVNVQAGAMQGQKPLRAWSTGLFGCCEDPMICICVCFCHECYGCCLSSNAGETCCLPFCVPGWLIALRAHVRGKHGIEGSVCNDCLMVSCCNPCVMCQLGREIDNIKKGKAPA